MRKTVAFSLLFLIVNMSLAYSQESSFDFKGIALKSDISIIENDPRFTCKVPQDQIYDRHCVLNPSARETIADAPINFLMLGYYYDLLESIYISFDEKYFSGVISALNEKYGTVEVKTETVRNRAGGSFENRIYTWGRNKATLKAERYSSRLDSSSVLYRTDFAIEEFARRKKAADKKKAGDL